MDNANQFELLLNNHRQQRWAALLLPFLFAACGWILVKLSHAFLGSSMLFPLAFLAAAGIMVFVIIKLFLKLTSDAALVMINGDTLTIQYHKSGNEMQIPFASIAACQITAYTTLTLKLTCKDGNKLKINDTYHLSQGSAMVKRFQEAFHKYQCEHE